MCEVCEVCEVYEVCAPAGKVLPRVRVVRGEGEERGAAVAPLGHLCWAAQHL